MKLSTHEKDRESPTYILFEGGLFARNAQGVDLTEVSFDSEQAADSLDATLSIIDGLALTGLASRIAVLSFCFKPCRAAGSRSKEGLPEGNFR